MDLTPNQIAAWLAEFRAKAEAKVAAMPFAGTATRAEIIDIAEAALEHLVTSSPLGHPAEPDAPEPPADPAPVDPPVAAAEPAAQPEPPETPPADPAPAS